MSLYLLNPRPPLHQQLNNALVNGLVLSECVILVFDGGYYFVIGNGVRLVGCRGIW